MEIYEGRIIRMQRQLNSVVYGFRAAKRDGEYNCAEVKRLVELVMQKTEKVNKLDERLYKMVEKNLDKERRYEQAKRQLNRRLREL